ncbi:MAG: winged helix-turn-helix transcriptional regulator [Candidatus Nealsonbacteria bacterium]|nr:winged helix-turn-helix transcriptional regulator [Candidatus Nealsonbacteria bacterium]
MEKKTSHKIINYLKENKQASGSELADFLNISDRAVRKQLKNLLDEGIVYKAGKPPKVFYLIKKNQSAHITNLFVLSDRNKRIIEENYLIITPSGERKEGAEGFIYWCNKNNLDISKIADDYIKTFEKYNKYKKEGVIKGNDKFQNTFKEVFLDDVYYLDFYNIERFGKTKLGQLLLYGKQSGNKKIIKEIIEMIKPKIERIVKTHRIDAVGFIPWTVKREVQIMRELEKGLKLSIGRIKIEKIKTEITVPQKTLSKLGDRIENAEKTIVLTEKIKYKNILLIDDAVGSGATMNETARQIKNRGIAKKVVGIAVTGSFKGFDVISEV